MKFKLKKIKKITTFSYDDIVYDLSVMGDHSYNIGGVVVHNSHCSSRIQAAVGCPQLSTIIDCADAVHGLGGMLISDGGVRHPGDASKSICANADMVMIGGMFAGTDEAAGEIIEEDGEKYKIFYGMSSKLAQEKHGSGMKEYRTSEGTVTKVKYKGPVENVIKDLLGGMRSTGTYIGARDIKDFGKRATFIRVNRVHDKNL